jgi:hypothetical protein
MALRIRPRGDEHPLCSYAPAFDISNVLPSLCKGLMQGLKAENQPEWLQVMCAKESLTDDDLYEGLLLYIRAVKLMQTDADVDTVDAAFALTGFDRLHYSVRGAVMARMMDYVNALFLTAIKDATRLVEGGTPVRVDVQATLDEIETMTHVPRKPWWAFWRRARP